MNSLLFVLGRTPDLSILELETFYSSVRRISEHIALIEDGNESVPYHALFEQLGGCIKVAVVVGEEQSITPTILASYIRRGNKKSITFGISSYDDTFPISETLLQLVKRELEQTKVHIRFIVPQTGNDLTSVVIVKQKVDEWIIVKSNQDYVIARTVGVQSFESWNHRDFGRPFADAKSGMLPPKVARMIVNIAGSQFIVHSTQKNTMLDPFCGMGTIVTEALLMGWKVIGSDQSVVSVDKAKKNIAWVMNNENMGGNDWKLFVSDATHISEHLEKQSIDAIVTEPFMGSARVSGNYPIIQLSNSQINEIRNIIKGLEKLYIGCLKDWHSVLKYGGKVVIALPEYAIGRQLFFVKKVIDKCENLGYTVLAGPIEYSRPQAIVRRKFFVFQKI